MEETKRTEISELGEFGLIDRISKNFKTENARTLLGIGDDAAEIAQDSKYNTLISTDLLTEGVHFDLTYTPLPHLGYKAVAVNVSDIAAMNGRAEQITVSLGLSNRFSVEAIDALYEGIAAACKNYGVDLVGGDTTSSASGLIISITAIGRALPEKITRRSGSQKGDILCVTGDLGAAYMGLQVLRREKEEFKVNPDMQADLEGFDYVLRRQLRPEARADIIAELADLQIVPTSMIDISDGLASELLHLSKASGLGLKIYEENIPIAKETYDVAVNDFKISPLSAALHGGEDYELLFTLRQEDFEKIKNHDDISFIGFMEGPDKKPELVSRNQQIVPITAQGWVHF